MTPQPAREALLRERGDLIARLSAVEELLVEEHGWPYPDGATCLRKCPADTPGWRERAVPERGGRP